MDQARPPSSWSRIRLVIADLRPREERLSRTARIVGWFVLYYFGIMSASSLLFSLAFSAGILAYLGLVPVAIFLAIRLSIATVNTNEHG